MSGRVMETINYFLANLIFLRLRIIADKYISYIIKINSYICVYICIYDNSKRILKRIFLKVTFPLPAFTNSQIDVKS